MRRPFKRPTNHIRGKRYMVSVDLAAEVEHPPNVVFASGPFLRKRFRTEEAAQRWIDEHDYKKVRISILGWIRLEDY